MNATTKTFRAPTMMEALQQVQHEFGADALVLSMRKVTDGHSWQLWKNPMVEIIAMKRAESPKTAPPGVKGISTAAYRSSIQATEPVVSGEKETVPLTISSTIQNLNQNNNRQGGEEWRPFIPPHISTKTESAARTSVHPQPAATTLEIEPESTQPATTIPLRKVNLPGKLAASREQLLQQGLDESLVSQLITNCINILPPGALDDDKRIRHLLQRQLEAEIHVVNEQELYTIKPILIVGASNAGKKLLTAQLAAMAKQRFNKNIRWICADTIRTGAITEARTYTDLINIPLQLAYTPRELSDLCRPETPNDLIFVDMPDFNPRVENSVVELGDFLTHIPNRTILLASSATTKEVDLMQIMVSVKPFRIKGLVFTQMSETLSYGNIYQLTRKSQIPLAYFTTGIHIFNNLQIATARDLVDSLFGEGYAL